MMVMATDQEYIKYLREIVQVLNEMIQDLKQRQAFAEEEEKEYIAGRLFSYYEMLNTMKFYCRENNLSEEELGLWEI